MDCESFYSEREQRTVEYRGEPLSLAKPIGLSVSAEAAETVTGQQTAMAMANMMARVHRRVLVQAPVTTAALQNNRSTLEEELINSMQAIDPCGSFEPVAKLPDDLEASIGIGNTDPVAQLYVGASDSIGYVDRHPIDFAREATLLGAGMAASLGAAAVFRSVHALPIKPAKISAWNIAEDEQAAEGPSQIEPLDVGNVLLVGAGAVSSAFAYWLSQTTYRGEWTVVDRDVVQISNLNRNLTARAADAGFPDREPTPKAENVASAIGGLPYVGWYHEWSASLGDDRPDLVICLANDHDVRHLIWARFEPLLLHATTSRNWSAQLHRHLATDDCIDCRMSDSGQAHFMCSTGPVPSAQLVANDAALPFLSAAAGLLLLSSLYRLQAGELTDVSNNHWTIDLGSTNQITQAQRHRCREMCPGEVPISVRKRLAMGTRWEHL